MPELNEIAAKITKASGPVTVVRDGENLTLNEGDSVFATDTIKTQSSAVEITFADGAISMLSPETTMTVQEFSMDLDSPSFVLQIAAGAMRTISGEVVEQNPDAFKVTTPRATVGIRGTDFIIKIDSNGDETHALLSLSQGHNLTLTGYQGQMFSFNTANQGAFIGADGEGAITPYTFTQQEIEELVKHIVGALEDEEAQYRNSNNDADGLEAGSTINFELSDDLASALSEESLNLLEQALEEVDINLLNRGGLKYSESFGIINTSTSVGAALDHSGLVVAGFERVEIQGDTEFYADFEDINGAAVTRMMRAPTPLVEHNAEQQQIIIEGDNLAKLITGDVGTLNNALLHASRDIITANNVTTGGVIAGDAGTINSGQLNAGSDTITALSMESDAKIYGDVQIVSGGTVNYGNDVIAVATTMSENSAIYGQGGDDILSAEVMTDDSIMDGGDDTDNLSVNILEGNAQMLGGAGHDIFEVKSTMSGGTINVGAGTSSVSIATMSGGEVIGNADVDTINITSMTDGTVNTDAGADSISIKGNMQAGTINAGAGDDTIEVFGQVTSASIDAGDDNDTLIFKTMPAGAGVSIDGGAGDDTLSVTNAITSDINLEGNNIENYKFASIQGGTITGTTGNDNFLVNSWTGGSIVGNGGTDTVTFDNSVTSNMQITGSDIDSYIIKSLATGGNISVNAQTSASIEVETWNGGTVNVGSSADSVNVVNLLTGNATINSNDTSNTTTVNLNSSGLADNKGIATSGSLTLSGNGKIDLQFNGADLDLNHGTIVNASSIAQRIEKVSGTSELYGTYKADNDGAVLDVGSITGYGKILGGDGEDTIGVFTYDNAGTVTGGGVMLEPQYALTAQGKSDITAGVIDGGNGADVINIGGSLPFTGDPGSLKPYIIERVADTTIYNFDKTTVDTVNVRDYDGILNLKGDGGFVINVLADSLNSELNVESAGSVTLDIEHAGAEISLGSGGNNVTIDRLHRTDYTYGGGISSGTGDDTIKITDYASGRISVDSGDNHIEVAELREDDVVVGDENVGRISTGDGNDYIYVGKLEISHLNEHDGKEEIWISHSRNNISSGEGQDTIIVDDFVRGVISGGNSLYKTLEYDEITAKISNTIAGRDETNLVAGHAFIDASGGDKITLTTSQDGINYYVGIGDFYSTDDNLIINGTTYNQNDILAVLNGNEAIFGNLTITFEDFIHNSGDLTGKYIFRADTLETVSSDDTFNNNIMNIIGDVNISGGGSNVLDNYISGDVGKITSGKIVTGNELINGTTINLTNGTIYGDAHSVESDVFLNVEYKDYGADSYWQGMVGDFGFDTITLGSMSGGMLFGDFGVVGSDSTNSEGTISFGNDEITIIGEMSGGKIYGDATLAGNGSELVEFNCGGFDLITIGHLSGGEVYGNVDVAKGFTSDVFDVDERRLSLASNEFVIENMTGGTIYGSAKTFGSKDEDTSVYSGGGNNFSIDHMSGGIIYGQAESLHNNTITASGNATSIYILNMLSGTIYGDAKDAHDDVKNNGNSFIIMHEMKGGTIYADVENLYDNAENTGNDNIFIFGNMTGGTIYTDAKNNYGTGINGGKKAGSDYKGNDEISMGSVDTITGEVTGGVMSGGVIYTGAGEDIIGAAVGNSWTVFNHMTGTAKIYSGADADYFNIRQLSGNAVYYAEGGADSITIATMTGGTVRGDEDGDYSADTFTITDMSGGTLYGEYPASGANSTEGGGDKFTITNLSGTGKVYGVGGNDSIKIGIEDSDGKHIGSMTGGSIDAGAGEDTISIHDLDGGTVGGGADADTITITNLDGATINGDAGNDTISITNIGADTVNLGLGTINGGAGDDSITVAGTFIGNIFGDAGVDYINLTDMAGGAVHGGADADNINITGTLSGGSISSTSGADNISVTNMTGGTINGSDGVNITIDNMNGGHINAGSGASTITVDNLTKAGNLIPQGSNMPSFDLGNDNAADSLSITIDVNIITDYFMELKNLDFSDGDRLIVKTTGGASTEYSGNEDVYAVNAQGELLNNNTYALSEIINGSVSGAAGVILHAGGGGGGGTADLIVYFGN